jgi:hypothetical protein
MGVPYWARKEKAIEEVAYLVGDFEELDVSSLPGLGPIRVKVSCKAPKQIKGASKVYFNNKGFMVSWLAETEKTQESKHIVNDKPANRDSEEEEEEDDEEFSDNYFPFKDGSQKDVDGFPTESSKQRENRGKQVAPGDTDISQETQGVEQKCKTSPHKVQEKVILSSKGSLVLKDSEATDQMELCLDSEDPILFQSQASDMMLEENFNQAFGTTTQDKVSLEVSNQPKQGPVLPMQAERRSDRQAGSGTPILEKAEKLKAKKDLQGTSNNPFTILQNIDN